MKKLLQEVFTKLNNDQKITELKSSVTIDTIKNNKNIVFLTLSNDNRRLYTVKGAGESLTEAIINATETYYTYKKDNFIPTSLKIDIINKFEKINRKKFDIVNCKIRYERNVEGISFDETFDVVLLPSEITSYSILRKRKFDIVQLLQPFKTRLPRKTDNFARIVDSKLKPTYKFETETYYINANEFFKMYENQRIFDDITQDELYECIKLTKDNYFKEVVQSSGKFIYSYRPEKDIKEKRYNILRHAGTIYSMAEAYELMPDDELLNEIKRSIEWLVKKIEPWEVDGKNVQVVVERDVQKVGGNALAVVALAKYTKITNDKQYIPLMQDLVSWFGAIQKDNGDYMLYKQTHSTGEISDFISGYYPGESILALVRLYDLDKKEEWLDVAENMAKYLITIRDKGKTKDDIAIDHWLLYALNDLYRYRENPIYLEHSYFIAKAAISKQITKENAERKTLIGSYATPSGRSMGSTPVACRSEGLSATYRLAKYVGDDDFASELLKSIKLGVEYQLQMQLRPETVMYFKRKKRCLGAFHASMRSYQLQNDFTQHNISSLIALHDLMNDQA